MGNGHFGVFMGSRFLQLCLRSTVYLWNGYLDFSYLCFLWIKAIQFFRNLLLLPCLPSIFLCSFMVGYPFSSYYTTSCIWGLIRGHIMSILACGISMGFYQWIPGSGVLFFTVGKQPLPNILTCTSKKKSIYYLKCDHRSLLS